MSELKPDTTLFAGRYDVIRLSGTDKYGYVYEAIDHSDDSRVSIHEFFPAGMCRRDAESQNMAILKASAQEASALYRNFSDFVTALHDGKVSGMPRLVHAFKDHGTAYYVLPESSGRVPMVEKAAAVPPKSAPAVPKAPAAVRSQPATRPERPVRRERPAEEEEELRSPSDTGRKLASYHNAVLWYRIIIVLLIAIIALLVYLNFFTNSPKVTATGSAAAVEVVVPGVSDSLPGL